MPGMTPTRGRVTVGDLRSGQVYYRKVGEFQVVTLVLKVKVRRMATHVWTTATSISWYVNQKKTYVHRFILKTETHVRGELVPDLNVLDQDLSS